MLGTVEAVDNKLSSSSRNFNSNEAIRLRPVTLFTTDASLFADIQSTAHIHEFEKFWKRVHNKHIRTSSCVSSQTTNMVSSVIAITIMIVETTSMMHLMKMTKDGSENDFSSNDSGFMIDEHNDSTIHATSGCAFDSAAIPNRLHIIQCVNDIRRRIRELSHAQQDKGLESLEVQIEFIEGDAISFQSLLQMWVKESFTKTYAGVQGHLSFDLPETLDGCSIRISLDLEYTALPHGIVSPETQRLVEDMRRISLLPPSSVEVLQTVPLSSVDSSLIFGVPMSARAGLENDLSRYNEMQMLARQLWKFLSREDAGLLLCVSSGSDNNDGSSSGLHQSSELFLLVCQKAVQKLQPSSHHDSNYLPDISEATDVVPEKQQGGKAPCHGILYRYATKSQILCFGNEEEVASGEDETEIQYFGYIERSLETLARTGANPLLM